MSNEISSFAANQGLVIPSGCVPLKNICYFGKINQNWANFPKSGFPPKIERKQLVNAAQDNNNWLFLSCCCYQDDASGDLERVD